MPREYLLPPVEERGYVKGVFVALGGGGGGGERVWVDVEERGYVKGVFVCMVINICVCDNKCLCI
jgi:hypothetical protein